MMTDWDWNHKIAEAMEEPNMTIPWEAGKEYTLRNGFCYRVYALDGGGGWKIHGAYFNPVYEEWVFMGLSENGKYFSNSDFDLLPPASPRIKGECWLVVTSSGVMGAFESKSAAVNQTKDYYRAAIIHVPYDVAEGEGL